MVDIDALRQRIGPKVRRLRQERRWTLAELARRIAISESRLSELERGGGSFTAEQLLLLFRMFQVGPEDFVERNDAHDAVAGSLQTALMKFGARHLVADGSLVIRREHERPVDVVQDVLIKYPSARFLTALPPVLIENLSAVSYPVVQHAVVQAGVPNRWGWLLAQFLEALDRVGVGHASVRWRRDSARARTVTEHFLQAIPRPREEEQVDLMDPDLRSAASVRSATVSASEIDRKWHVLSRLGTHDFVGPLEVLRDAL